MGTTADKLNKLISTKADLKAALIEKGQDPGDVFSQYPAKVRAIKTDSIKLASIDILRQPTKTSYVAKEPFDATGMVVRAYFNNKAHKYVADGTNLDIEKLNGYTVLDYIEATGTQWINTGVTGHARWEFDIQFTNTTKRQLMGYWGSQDEYWGCQTDGKYGLLAGSTIGVAGGRDTIVHDFQQGAATLWTQNQTFGIGGNATLGSNQYQLFNIMGEGSGYTCYAKLWRCKCVQSGSLIRDFIPAQRNSDGYIGLYDIVNNVFYTNAGTGAFTAGHKGRYQWLDYIQSSGTQYINTDLAENSVYGLRMVFEVPSYATAWQSLVSGTLDTGFTVGTRNVDLTGFYVRLRGAETVNSGGLISGKTELLIKNGSININGTQKTTYTSGKLSEKTGYIYIFANNALSRYSNMKLYELEFYGSDGSILRSYVPCISPSGKVGLYDKINKRFYGNNGTGNFIAGTAKESVPLYNRWIQTSSPNASPNTGTGFKALTTSFAKYFTPITKSHSSGSALYSMNTANNWWAPIGQKVAYSGGIPAADGSTQYETELWIRTDRFSDANQMKIYNGSLLQPIILRYNQGGRPL